METNWIEFIGYLGSLLVAISLSLKSVKNLRTVNFMGALAFVVYGLLIQSYPVVILNSYLCGANIYRLIVDKNEISPET